MVDRIAGNGEDELVAQPPALGRPEPAVEAEAGDLEAVGGGRRRARAEEGE